MNPILASLIFGEQAQAQEPVLDQYLYSREPAAAAKPMPKAKPATANLKGAAPAKPKTPEEVISEKSLDQQEAKITSDNSTQLQEKFSETNRRDPRMTKAALQDALAMRESIPGYGAMVGNSKASQRNVQRYDDMLSNMIGNQYEGKDPNYWATMDFSPLIDFWNRQTGAKVSYKPQGMALVERLMKAREESAKTTGGLQENEVKMLLDLYKNQFELPTQRVITTTEKGGSSLGGTTPPSPRVVANNGAKLSKDVLAQYNKDKVGDKIKAIKDLEDLTKSIPNSWDVTNPAVSAKVKLAQATLMKPYFGVLQEGERQQIQDMLGNWGSMSPVSYGKYKLQGGSEGIRQKLKAIRERFISDLEQSKQNVMTFYPEASGQIESSWSYGGGGERSSAPPIKKARDVKALGKKLEGL